jgi:lipoprotein NlpI
VNRFAVAVFFILGAAFPALANSADDFKAGVTAMRGGNLDEAIRLFTRVIKAGDLPKPDQAMVYSSRAVAHAIKGEAGKAFPDFEQAIRLKPDWSGPYFSRAALYATLGQYDKSIADYDAVIRLSPDFAPGYANRGVVRFEQGKFALAADDAAQSLKQSSDAYVAIWLHILRARAGMAKQDELAEQAEGMDRAHWPGQLADLFLGRITPEQTLAAAAKAGDVLGPSPACEAPFYVGEYYVLKKNPKAAKLQLQKAVKVCLKDSPETRAARADLKRLGG